MLARSTSESSATAQLTRNTNNRQNTHSDTLGVGCSRQKRRAVLCCPKVNKRSVRQCLVQDWWNATTIGEYWKLWNMPVHRWMLRTIYYPLIRNGALSACRNSSLGCIRKDIDNVLVNANVAAGVVVFSLQRHWHNVCDASGHDSVALTRAECTERSCALCLLVACY